MTITSTASRMPPYAGNGSATAFPVAIPFPDADCIRAILCRPGQADADLVRDTDFILTGAGDPAGGTLTFPKAGSAYGVLAEGQTLHILRVVPLTQERDWDNVDALDAEEIEAGDDRLTMLCQQLQEQLDRAVVLPPTAGEGADPVAYAAAVSLAREQATAAAAAATDSAAAAGADAAVAVAQAGSAAGSATTAATRAGEAAASAAAALDSAGDAATAQGLAEVARDAAQTAQALASAAQAASEDARDVAQAASAASEDARDAAQAAAAGLNLPAVGGADAGKLLAVNAGGTGYQLAAPATAATANTLALRDAAGNLAATLFNGTATSARYA